MQWVGKQRPVDGQCADAHIAIVGMACRFPGRANSIDAYWQALLEGVSATAEIPADRWSLKRFFHPQADIPGRSHVNRGAFLSQPLDSFDARFFRISPREAMCLDPQQRLLLEVAWEALEDSGMAADIRGSLTSVYVGGFMLDRLQSHSPLQRSATGPHTAVAHTMSMLSNRLSHVFDLRGPSLTVDTACSGSLVALHLACRALSNGECDAALCGGVNVMLWPDTMITLSKAGFLSPDGLCKTFDATADGYGRGEGAGVLVLKRLDDALRDGDTIRAVIAGTGVNQDGHTDSITSPSAEAQCALIRRVQQDAGVWPDQIQYVEAHGTGTQAGDRTEAYSIGTTIATRRVDGESLWIGSAKTAIGHLEAAAGIAGVIKTALALEHRTIPPHGNLHAPNPAIDFDALRLRIPLEPTPWPPTTERAGAAVNAFGYGGTNAHAILLEAPPAGEQAFVARARPAVFPVSAASPRALASRARQLANWMRANPALDLDEIGYTQACHRPHYDHRVAFVAQDATQLAEQLDRWERSPESGEREDAIGTQPLKIAFVYTGMGVQFRGMGAALVAREPAARAVLKQCEKIWLELGEAPFASLFEESEHEPITAPRQAQIANFVLQVMLTEVAATYGLRANCYVGHSVGEIAAAYASRALTLESALRIVHHRSRLMERVRGRGAMLAVALSPIELAPYLASARESVDLAAFNGPHATTLAGDTQAIDRLCDEMTNAGVFHRRLDTEVAYHSRHLDGFETEFKAALDSLVPREPDAVLYSTVTASRIDSASQDATYWWRNARAPVRWGDTLAAMLDDGVDAFVEIGPHPVLARTIAECASQAGKRAMTCALHRRDHTGVDTLLDELARLYAAGADLDWRTHYHGGRRIALPAYPWDREQLWTETQLARADRLGLPGHPLLSALIGEPQPSWEGDIAAHLYPYLLDHRIAGETIFPAAAAIEMALLAYPGHDCGPRCIDQLTLHHALAIDDSPLVRLQVDSDGRHFAIYSRSRTPDAPWSRFASGRFGAESQPCPTTRFDRAAWHAGRPHEAEIDVDAFYSRVADLGLNFGPAFRCLRRITRGEGESIGAIALASAQAIEAAEYFIHPCLLDGALQTLLTLVLDQPALESTLCLPVSIHEVRLYRKAGAAATCRACITERHNGGATGSVTLFTADGEISATLTGVSVRTLHLATAANAPASRDWTYRTAWVPAPVEPVENAGRSPQTWIVHCDDAGIGDAWAERARKQGDNCITIHAGTAYRRHDAYSFDVSRGARNDIRRVLTEIGAPQIDAIAYFCEAVETDAAQDPTGLSDVLEAVHLAQEVERHNLRGGLGFLVVSYRAQSVLAKEIYGHPGQQALIGLLRVLRAERPDWRIHSIDVDTRDAQRAAETVHAEWTALQADSEVAFRGDVRYVSRIERAELPSPNRASTQLGASFAETDGAYLVTGGSNGLGLMTARWLAERGARHIAILSRRGPVDEWAHQTLGKLQAGGTSVWIVNCDVAERVQLQGALAKLKSVMPAIRGVVHAAATVQDASFGTVTDRAIENVFQAKAIGAWNLHSALIDSPLDFFVTYSSVSALIGNPGQAAYAAANGFLEGLVRWRRAQGKSGTNVQWGVIGEVGMVARSAELQATLEARGLHGIAAEDALEILGQAIAHNWESLGIFDIDWARWRRVAQVGGPVDPRLAGLVQAPAGEQEAERDAGPSLSRQLDTLPADQHWQLVYAEVTNSICKVLQIKDSARIRGTSRLSELGLDSLMAGELAQTLNKRTGIDISPLVLLRGLNVAELSGYVLKHA